MKRNLKIYNQGKSNPRKTSNYSEKALEEEALRGLNKFLNHNHPDELDDLLQDVESKVMNRVAKSKRGRNR